MSSSENFKYNENVSFIKEIFSSKIKFSPPKPSYTIVSQMKDSSSSFEKIDFEILSSMPFKKYNIPDWINVTLHSLTYKKNKQLIFMHIENNYNQNKFSSNKVIIYSHENNADIIRLLPFLIDLSVQNKCNIISYDYRGFGCSSSYSNEENFTNSYEYTMNYALNHLNYNIENILLMGRDIGVVHSLIIASRNSYNKCKGLILISPIINEKIININIIKNIICQTLIIKERNEKEDNKEDETILMYRQINNVKVWLPKNKNLSQNNQNEDILLNHRKKFIYFIREYLKSNDEYKNSLETLSRRSTNVATLSDNNEIYYDLENQNETKENSNKGKEQNKSKKDYIQKFEEEEGYINYNNDDY